MWPVLLLACDPASRTGEGILDPVVPPPVGDDRPNFLVIVLDDVGAANWGRLGTGDPGSYPQTPNLDALADRGVVFRNAWSEPTCTPSRVAALTGRAPWRTGVGRAIEVPSDWHLPPGTPTIASVLGDAGYATAAIGKWHLGEQFAGPYPVPDAGWGFEHTAGTIANLGPDGNPWSDPLLSYYRYLRHEDGDAAYVWGYATTRVVDDVLAWTGTAPEPWFTWVGFQAAHAPFQLPPPDLVATPVNAASPDLAIYAAMIEAVDAELGRLLDGLGDALAARTVVIVVGDNGMPFQLVPDELSNRVKGSTFEGGIHVPFIAAGAGVSAGGRESDALISLVDLGPTLAALGSAVLPSSDGVDFSAILADPDAPPPRAFVFAEQFKPNFDPQAPPTTFELTSLAVRDEQYKLRRIGFDDRWIPDQLYDLLEDPQESTNLLIEGGPGVQATANRLRNALLDAHIDSPVPYQP